MCLAASLLGPQAQTQKPVSDCVKCCLRTLRGLAVKYTRVIVDKIISNLGQQVSSTSSDIKIISCFLEVMRDTHASKVIYSNIILSC